MAGESAREHGAAESGAEQTEHSGGRRSASTARRTPSAGSSTYSRTLGKDGVEAAALDDIEEAEHVALDAAHAVGDPGLGGPALQGEQGVGAGVDDGDVVAELGDGHREVAAAASGVEHVEFGARLAARDLDAAVEGLLQDVPDHGGTERGAGTGGVRARRRRLSVVVGGGRAHRVRHGS